MTLTGLHCIEALWIDGRLYSVLLVVRLSKHGHAPVFQLGANTCSTDQQSEDLGS
jgi:hypothetical protein